MKKHIKIYLKHFGLTGHEFIPCEICGSKANDIHHIKCKGMGGSKTKDSIENLMALCRAEHEKYGDKKKYLDFLIEKHNKYLFKDNSILLCSQTPEDLILVERG